MRTGRAFSELYTRFFHFLLEPMSCSEVHGAIDSRSCVSVQNVGYVFRRHGQKWKVLSQAD